MRNGSSGCYGKYHQIKKKKKKIKEIKNILIICNAQLNDTVKISISCILATHQNMELCEPIDSQRDRQWRIRRINLLSVILQG